MRVLQFRIPHSAFALLLLNHRDLEPIRIGQSKRPVAPRGFGRLAVERPSLCLDARRQGDDVLDRRHPPPEAVPLPTSPSFSQIVPPAHDSSTAPMHLSAPDHLILLP